VLDFTKIKLIIWDLDETLWEGTLSDNDSIQIKNKFLDFINNALDRGIVHSICSKNDYDKTKEHLVTMELWDLFVFSSISWEPKGERIKNLIKNMNLREENVLFVDDNTSNLHEAVYYCPKIQTCLPTELMCSTHLLEDIKKIDKSRPRLEQYRLLEEKVNSQQSFSSNEEFLMSCNICVDFHDDCLENIDRIHELIMRSNQLNYTKFRQEKDELAADLNLPNTKAAYITVKDSFGDYGIVGFYMIVNDAVKHFLFSCRTLGMLVEQYVYMQIGCPKINVVGDTITRLNDADVPAWINCKDTSNKNLQVKHDTGNQKILFKGPCDIDQIFSFISETPSIKAEFTYINDKGISVEGYNHTSQLVSSLSATTDEKTKLIEDAPWLDEKMLDGSSWQEHDVIVFSLLTDGNLGIYQHRETGWQIALCEKYYDMTDPKNQEDYINKKIFTSLIDFSKDDLIHFAEKYKYVNNAQGDVTLQNLNTLYAAKKKNAKLVLLLGSEKPYAGKTKPSYENRDVFHKVLNDKVKSWSEDKHDVFLIEIGNYITTQKDYTDTINHFQKKVYYHIAQDLLAILNSDKATLQMKGKLYLHWVNAKKYAYIIAKKILKRK